MAVALLEFDHSARLQFNLQQTPKHFSTQQSCKLQTIKENAKSTSVTASPQLDGKHNYFYCCNYLVKKNTH